MPKDSVTFVEQLPTVKEGRPWTPPSDPDELCRHLYWGFWSTTGSVAKPYARGLDVVAWERVHRAEEKVAALRLLLAAPASSEPPADDPLERHRQLFREVEAMQPAAERKACQIPAPPLAIRYAYVDFCGQVRRENLPAAG